MRPRWPGVGLRRCAPGRRGPAGGGPSQHPPSLWGWRSAVAAAPAACPARCQARSRVPSGARSRALGRRIHPRRRRPRPPRPRPRPRRSPPLPPRRRRQARETTFRGVGSRSRRSLWQPSWPPSAGRWAGAARRAGSGGRRRSRRRPMGPPSTTPRSASSSRRRPRTAQSGGRPSQATPTGLPASLQELAASPPDEDARQAAQGALEAAGSARSALAVASASPAGRPLDADAERMLRQRLDDLAAALGHLRTAARHD